MFNRSIHDYVLSQDFTNHLQVKIGDVVTVSEAGFTQLSREKHFWTTVLVGGTLTAVTMGLATGFVGVGIVGSEIAVGLTAAEIAASGGLVGGVGSALLHQAHTDDLVRRSTLKTMPFLGKVKRIHQKNFSELHHVEVEFHIPDGNGGYDTRTEWIDAHHLMGLITKVENDRRNREIERLAKQAQDAYDAKMLKKHRASFAPENVVLREKLASTKVDLTTTTTEVKELQTSLQSAKNQRNLLAALGPFALLLVLL